MAARVAIVTGAAQGIGESVVLRLAQDGLDIAILDVKGKEELLQGVSKKIQDSGRRCLWLTSDVTSEEEVKSAIDKVVATLGGVDVMIANAGITLFKSFLETTTEEWNRQISVNTTGVMLCFKYAALQMIKQGRGGRLVAACSGAGKRGTLNMSAYSASKFAVRGLTQALGQELRPHKITVNGYAPGMILTPMLAHPDDDKFGGLGSVAKMAAKMPDDLEGAEPKVIADLVAYLISPEAYFVTGQTINIDGGLHFD